MDKVALLPTGDRAALFGETGTSRGVGNLIIEKDFWVCWTLKRLFEPHKTDVPTLVFKGGTPLSKAYRAIRRFSEDIDLLFDRADLGYTGERDPEKGGISKKRARQLAAHAQDFAIAYLPAYAPELNPEEQCNAFVKRAMENALPGSVDDLHRLVRLEFARLQ